MRRLLLVLVGGMVLWGGMESAGWRDGAWAAAPKGQKGAKLPVAAPAHRAALLKVEDWQQTPLSRLQPEEIDRLLDEERKKDNGKTALAPLVGDEPFLRRVTLDLTGRLPKPEDVRRFRADTDPHKRASRIDALLNSDEYAQHWAHYWSDVLSARVNEQVQRLTPVLEEWLYQQFKQNRGWGDIVQDMLTADAVLSDTEPGPKSGPKQPLNGAAYLIATRFHDKTRSEGAIDAAAETARIFLGIQLQCAQCHNHPFDQWERVQFHQLAAYFARSGGRPGRHDRYGKQGALGDWALVNYRQGEYEMPGRKDPNKLSLVHPAFLDGSTAGEGLNDKERRQTLARAVVDKNNYWFAAAYVNRTWGELMGQAFYQPVDDMGPQKEAVLRPVLTRLTGAFRADNYDVKALFRLVLNTRVYQRQLSPTTMEGEHLHFSARLPERMAADVLWRTLSTLLEPADAKVPANKEGRFARPQNLAKEFITAFQFEPGGPAQQTLPQALLLMNGPTINYRLSAGMSQNLLARLLKDCPDDREALRQLYLRALGRKPGDGEMDKCRKYLARVGKRSEAFEDILWALINSAEFQTRR